MFSIIQPSLSQFKIALSNIEDVNKLVWFELRKCMVTPLHMAVHNMCKSTNKTDKNILLQIIQILIDNKADVNAIDSTNSTPLMYAIYFNNYCLTKYLMYTADYINYNLVNNNNSTCLSYAIYNYNYPITLLLLEKSRNSIVNKHINQAIFNNNIDIFKLLLKHNTPINNFSIFYALDNLIIPYGSIVNYTSIEILNIIFKMKPNMQIKNSIGDNPIHHFAKIIVRFTDEYIMHNILMFNEVLYRLIRDDALSLFSLKNSDNASFITIVSSFSSKIINLFLGHICNKLKDNKEFIEYVTVLNTMCNM